MTKQEAKSFKNFGFREKDIFGRLIFERYEDISYPFMKWHDELITYAKQEYGTRGAFIVHDINLGRHSDHSYHYKIDGHLSMAIDGHFRGLSPREAFIIIAKFRATGVGFYPDWHYEGWHIDKRPNLLATYWTATSSTVGQVYSYTIKDFERILAGD